MCDLFLANADCSVLLWGLCIIFEFLLLLTSAFFRLMGAALLFTILGCDDIPLESFVLALLLCKACVSLLILL